MTSNCSDVKLQLFYFAHGIVGQEFGAGFVGHFSLGVTCVVAKKAIVIWRLRLAGHQDSPHMWLAIDSGYLLEQQNVNSLSRWTSSIVANMDDCAERIRWRLLDLLWLTLRSYLAMLAWYSIDWNVQNPSWIQGEGTLPLPLNEKKAKNLWLFVLKTKKFRQQWCVSCTPWYPQHPAQWRAGSKWCVKINWGMTTIARIVLGFMNSFCLHSNAGKQVLLLSSSYRGNWGMRQGRKSTLNISWKDWCWSWSSNTLAIWCEEPTHWQWPWYWERLKVGGEGGWQRMR